MHNIYKFWGLDRGRHKKKKTTCILKQMKYFIWNLNFERIFNKYIYCPPLSNLRNPPQSLFSLTQSSVFLSFFLSFVSLFHSLFLNSVPPICTSPIGGEMSSQEKILTHDVTNAGLVLSDHIDLQESQQPSREVCFPYSESCWKSKALDVVLACLFVCFLFYLLWNQVYAYLKNRIPRNLWFG